MRLETSDAKAPDRLCGVRVLIAEDEAIVAMELQQLMEDHGAEALGPCYTIESALEAVAGGAPSVAILDVRLGRSLISPVASALAERGVPFVFYSGQSERDSAVAAWPSAPLVSKPCSSGTLIAAVESVLATA
jgi:DNA-binding NarL/FixJ family response regulator